MHHQIPLFFSSPLSLRLFPMPLEGFSFMKRFATFGMIIYATDPLLQNMTLRSFASFDSPWIFLNYKTLEDLLNYVRQYYVVFHTLYSEWKSVTPIFVLRISEVTHYLTAVKHETILVRTSLRGFCFVTAFVVFQVLTLY